MGIRQSSVRSSGLQGRLTDTLEALVEEGWKIASDGTKFPDYGDRRPPPIGTLRTRIGVEGGPVSDTYTPEVYRAGQHTSPILANADLLCPLEEPIVEKYTRKGWRRIL